ncbi:MAG: transporter substrate-binding domain-containing protein [Chlamydiales bacterium]|nr:transporter substrate-binding domain-containing protein [Chlamydiales bacterium]
MKKCAPLLLFLIVFCTGCFWSKSKNKQYTVFRSNSIEGINLQGKETSIQGFTNDLLFEIARLKGIRIKINTLDHGKTGDLISMKGADGVVGVVDATLQNRKFYVISEPFFTFGPVVVMRMGETYKDLDSLKNKVVGFDRAYAGLVQNRDDLSFILKPYDQMTYAMEDLVNSKLDAVILDSIRAYQLVGNFYANTLKVASAPLIITNFCLIVNEGKHVELIKIFNEGLAELKKQGTYQKMLNYWGLVDPLYNSEIGSSK